MCQRIWRNSAYLSNLTAKAEAVAAIKPVPFVDWLANPDAPPGSQLPAGEAVLPTRIALENLVWIDDADLEVAWSAPFKDRAKIRKIWEVGVEVVLVQTAIQLEGDVITRISPRLTSGANIDDVMKIHQHSIETSMKMWSRIVDTVARLPKAFGL